ncbi:hypothetical protein IMZ48_38080 [Candidatus Bathyarchaeota archaeon]|nr:hypothetical protein [Candidatus Bathyarchaeota archaeon]
MGAITCSAGQSLPNLGFEETVEFVCELHLLLKRQSFPPGRLRIRSLSKHCPKDGIPRPDS